MVGARPPGSRRGAEPGRRSDVAVRHPPLHREGPGTGGPARGPGADAARRRHRQRRRRRRRERGRRELPSSLARGGPMTVVETTVPVEEVFASALRGRPCLLLDADGVQGLLPTDVWLGDADPVDEAFLRLCQGPTVDIGCGPGRMAHALALRGQLVLGIDLLPEAVRLSLGRGVATLLRDVFEPVPGEGRWSTALLADGNIGI